MALRYAVLGLLSKEKMSGYDLAQRFAVQFSHFWNAHHTQIYRELQKLETEGMVTHLLVEQQERPDKKIYELTPTGLHDLMQWLAGSPKPPTMKNESLLRVSLFHLVPTDQAIAFFERSRQMHVETMEQMKAWKRAYYGEGDLPAPEQIGEFLSLDYGMRFVQAWVEWCEYAIGVLRKMDARES